MSPGCVVEDLRSKADPESIGPLQYKSAHGRALDRKRQDSQGCQGNSEMSPFLQSRNVPFLAGDQDAERRAVDLDVRFQGWSGAGFQVLRAACLSLASSTVHRTLFWSSSAMGGSPSARIR